MKYEDRRDAGIKLSHEIPTIWYPDAVYGVASGGAVVGVEIAFSMKVRLEIAYVTRLPIPWNPEVSFGAVASDGEVILDEGHYRQMGLSYMEVQKIARTRLNEIKRKEQNSSIKNESFDLKNKTIILIDDGLATGYTCYGAAIWLRRRGAERIYLASPVAHQSAIELLLPVVDDMRIILVSNNKVFTLSDYYRDFHQLGDRDIKDALTENRNFLRTVNP